ncbi:MAG TPA: UvrD-helicase domain-containing protein [Candidatus Polarisedimenticolia bacterium]|jgi:ATP-dependent helicase/nuclease subunit A|nr:UvrD-helicase domain-containing protein [Candidatus Polarisedimenticolia bacterium]
MAGTPTRAQKDAVERDAPDLCVTAGAGSGKTRVLVDRFVRLVLDAGVPPDRILAITFTEKAAAEMKERIAQALEARGGEEWRRAAEFAAVSTIDSFCARILRENALDASVDPRFTVLEELDADRLLEEAVDAVLLARPEVELADLLSRTGIPALPARRGIPDLPKTLCELYKKVRATGKAVDLATLSPPALPEPASANLRSALAEVRRLLEAGTPTPLQFEKGRALLPLVEEVEGVRGSAAEMAAEFARLAARVRLPASQNEPLKVALQGVQNALSERLSERLEEEARPLRALFGELLGELDGVYEARKRAAASLDFADLGWKARALLAGSPAVRRRLARTFRHIFVDEFQDTNPLQKEILDLLRAGNCLFATGDPKQSIYGFRDADVGILARFRREVEPARGHVALADNFRSRPEIVSFANRLFASGLWRPGEIAFEAMAPAGDFSGKSIPSVELLVAEGTSAAEGRRSEAEALAARLEELVEERAVVATRTDAEKAGAPLSYGDVAILFRSTAGMRFYERALADRQIPYFVQKGRGYFQTQEVRDLVNLVRVLDNPRDDAHLAAVLRSPLCGLDEDDLYLLCRRAPGPPPKKLVENLAARADQLPKRSRGRLQAFADLLDRLRMRKGQGPLWMALDEVVSATRLTEAALLHFDGKRRLANLRKVVELVRHWEARGSASLPELVEILEAAAAPEVRESEATIEASGDDVVQLMTVHAAKGLEFPAVVLADLGREERAASHREIFRRDLGLGIPLQDPETGLRGLHPASYAAARRALEESAAQEENRLLYVAVTRAQEHLILSGWRKKGRAASRSWLKAILEALGGEDALRADPALRWEPASRQPSPRARRTSLLERHGEAVAAGAPLPEFPESAAARDEAERLLRRIALPLPPAAETPFLTTTTEIVQHRICPRRYHLRYLLAAPAREPWSRADGGERPGAENQDDEIPADLLGDRVHRILAEAPDSPRVKEILATLSAGDRIVALRQVETFRGSRLGREAAAGAAMKEVPFAIRRNEATIRGQIDLILASPDGGLQLVDYKTSRIAAAEVKEKALDYELQLRIYALAAREILGRRVASACLYFLEPDVVHPVEVTPAALEEAEASIASFFEAHRGRAFPQNPARHCFSCGYLEAYCPDLRGALSGERSGPGRR